MELKYVRDKRDEEFLLLPVRAQWNVRLIVDQRDKATLPNLASDQVVKNTSVLEKGETLKGSDISFVR